MIAYCPSQHRIFRFKNIQQRPLSWHSAKLKFYFTINVGEGTQMRRKNNAHHGNVWASTESTAGRSRTIGFHLSPASAEA